MVKIKERVQIEPLWFQDKSFIEVAEQLQHYISLYPFNSIFRIEEAGENELNPGELKCFIEYYREETAKG